jgi:hypothetical protein
MELRLERREQPDRTAEIPVTATASVLLTPPVDEDYWLYRVRLTETQSVIGFPKFGTVGIGFAVEEDWNTNLPYSCQAIDIVSHIWHNHTAGDPGYFADGDAYDPEREISIAQVYAAVRMIQDAATADRPGQAPGNSRPSEFDKNIRSVE